MSSTSVRKANAGSQAEPATSKKPVASVREVPRGDFVSIQSRAVLNDKLEEIANVAQHATCADGVAIALRDGNRFVCRASIGLAPELGVALQPGEGVCGQCLAESRLVLSQDLSGEVKSVLAAPVVSGGKVEGVIGAFSLRTGAFAASHSDLLCCLARDVANGLQSPERLQHEVVAQSEPETQTHDTLEPASAEQHLEILEAVTSSALLSPTAPLVAPPSPEAVPPPSEEPNAPCADPVETSSQFRFLGFAGNGESQASESLKRTFRPHLDVVMILAAILIALLTVGVWVHYRNRTPYENRSGELLLPACSHSTSPTV